MTSAFVEITDLRRERPAGVRGHVDRPKQGTRVEAASLDLLGWALGDEVPVVAVELVRDGRVFRRLALGVSRPDLAAAFPDAAGAGEAGFRASVSLLGHERELSLELHAVLADQRRVRFATIRAERGWREIRGPVRELVSVVIPCYDQAHFLGEAIESVLAQTYPQIELLVVDDGSHDNTAAVAARYPGVRYLRQRNQGLAAARNTGIRHTNGDFLVFLDSDDRLLAHALETGLGHMREHPEAAFVSGRWRLIGFDGLEIDTPEPGGLGLHPYRSLLTGCLISCPAAVTYRRGPLEELDGFDSTVDASADYDVYLRLSRDRSVAFHHETVADYRRHGANMTRDPSLILRSELAVLRRQRRHARSVAGGREAYRQGLLRARRYHGTALEQRACEHHGDRERAKLIGTLAVLARHDPLRLLATLRDLRDAGRSA